MSKILKDYKLLQLNYPSEVTRILYRIKDQHTFNERFKDRTFLGRINYPEKTKTFTGYIFNVLHLDTAAISVNNIKIVDNWLIGDVTILDTEEGSLIHNLSNYEYIITPIIMTDIIGGQATGVGNTYRLIKLIKDILKFEVHLKLHDHSYILEHIKDHFDYYPEDKLVLSN